ncbi:hypothetical protein A1O1_00007 [Capronia coronata CBS 617.96]|uniref:Transcription factor domain-containing protein n=1 Tax=Capronia coronata CBS 617.96 TaxID=1182541 RepID=W9ZK76_9EURO|nr:uncharacterized protein A1O1_00007 [Capronia coronata CBS 617.96]EXJ94889.1 hypothetical protein A1O1_00007 [Capronia coronata CBS 617.96]
MRSVQAIAILLGLFKNFGDFNLHSTLLAVGIRIAQTLWVNAERPNNSLVLDEIYRRVWWTFMICEWLRRPYGPPCVREIDFNIAPPLLLDDDELLDPTLAENPHLAPPKPRPIQYHMAMIEIARCYHAFNMELGYVCHDETKLEALVLKSDEALASVIDRLPPHLQAGSEIEALSDSDSNGGEQSLDWALWQRNSISLVFLFYRMAINRVLQQQWIRSQHSYVRSRAVCLGSARATVSLIHRYSSALARYRPWATTANLFSAAITLAVEAQFCDEHTAAAYFEDVERCIAFFADIKDQSVVAARAIATLQQYLSKPTDES